VHQSERGITVGDGVGDDAHGPQVEHLRKGELLALHLPMDAVDVFRATVDFGPDAGGAQHHLQVVAQLGDVALPVDALFRQCRRDPPIVVRLQEPERQVLEFPLELPQPQAVGERREYLARFQRQPFAGGGVAVLRGVELDQLARETGEHQPRIADHREQHLAQGFGLRGFQVMRGRGHRGEADVAKVLEFARQRADGSTEVPFDLARLFGLGSECGLGQQCRREQRVFGQ
jgi:hypothetical protein